MLTACGKRPVPFDVVRDAAERIERDLFLEFEDEVRSTEIGERVMQALMAIDTVAYVRFASVYREFATLEDFSRIVEAFDEPSTVSNKATQDEAVGSRSVH